MEAAIVFLPLLGAIIAGFFGKVLRDLGAQVITCLFIVISAILSWIVFFRVTAEGSSETITLFTWVAAPGIVASDPMPAPADLSNTEALGRLLFTKYVYFFQASGMILLVAMVGAIVLTHRVRQGVKRQRIGDQVARSSKDEVKVVKVQTGSGI